MYRSLIKDISLEILIHVVTLKIAVPCNYFLQVLEPSKGVSLFLFFFEFLHVNYLPYTTNILSIGCIFCTLEPNLRRQSI